MVNHYVALFIFITYIRLHKMAVMKPHLTLILILFIISNSFSLTCDAQSVTDVDGNTYTTVKIGSQTWMGQNLNVSKFRNGDPIPEANSDKEWEQASINKKPAWCFYENITEYGTAYGKLYNWYAANDKRGLAPKGWHISSEAEWNTLAQTLGGAALAGKKLKEKGADHWKTPNKEATNESGFTATPSGLNYSFGSFVGFETKAYWWTSTEDGDDTAIVFSLSYDSNELFNLFLNKGVGLSVRCMKD